MSHDLSSACGSMVTVQSLRVIEPSRPGPDEPLFLLTTYSYQPWLHGGTYDLAKRLSLAYS
jgi:hypothetical protein